MNRCPSSEQLKDLLTDRLSDSDAKALEAHVEACVPCQQALEQLTRPADVGPRAAAARFTGEDFPHRLENSPLPGAGLLPANAAAGESSPTTGAWESQGPIPSAEAVTILPAGALPQLAAPRPTVPGYEIVAELGRGGMGVVYQAWDVGLHRHVALKMILAGDCAGPEALARFQVEAQSVARLQHPHLVSIYEVGEHQGRPYLVLEYLDGGSLERHLDGRPQPARSAAQLVETLARAMDHAHQRGIVHRDLKPANILLQNSEIRTPNSELDQPAAGSDFGFRISDFIPKVTDFGLAKVLVGGGASPTSTGAILGTPSYMAPEQAEGKAKDIGPAVDMYALGAILYELLTGRPPFRAETPLDTVLQVVSAEPVPPAYLQPKVPRDLETICLKCLQKEPARRYVSAAALARDLRRFLAGEPIQARPVGKAERLWRWCRRNPTLAVAGGLAALALAAVVVLSVGFAVHARLAGERLQDALHSAQSRLAENDLDRALGAGDRDADPARALLWLARALETAPDSATDLRRIIRTNLAACRAQLLPLRGLFTHPSVVSAAAFSPDGRRLLTGAEDGQARVWDTATGAVMAALPHDDPVWAVAFGPEGGTAVTASGEQAWLWDVGKRRRVGPPLGHRGMIWAVAFSPDGRTVLTGSLDGTARLWRSDTGLPAGTPLPHGAAVRAVTFAPDGKTIVTGGDDGEARLWDPTTGKPTGRLFRHSAGGIYAAAFSPDGTRLVTGGEGQVILWNVATGAELYSLPHQGLVWAVAFSPDGKTFAAGAVGDQTAWLWDTGTGKPAGPPLRHPGAVRAVAFGPDGRTLVTGSEDKAARLWEVPAAAARGTMLQRPGPLTAMGFSHDGRTVVTGGGRQFRKGAGEVRRWDVGTGQPRGNRLTYPGAVWSVAISSDETLLLAGYEGGTAHVWKASTGEEVGRPLRHAELVSAVAFSPDGRTALTGSWDGTARLWEVGSGKPVAAPLDGKPRVSAAVFSPDGRTVLTGSADNTARLWDAATGRPLDLVLRHEAAVKAVTFGPGGETMATGSSDRTARAWDAAGRALGPPLPHPDKVIAVALSSDGSALLTAAGSAARLWEIRTGKALGPPVRHTGLVAAVAFRPDGTTFVTGSLDGTIHVSRIPVPITGDVAQVGLWVRVLTGLEMDESNAVRVLDGPTWWRLRQRLGYLGDSP